MAGSGISRRIVLGGCFLAADRIAMVAARANEPMDPQRLAGPQPGDRLVAAVSDADTTPLKPADVAQQDVTLAWAMDPKKQILRDGSRLNMVLLMRFDPTTLGGREAKMASDGIVAYSAVCTHQQCWVTDWLRTAQVLQCPCHQSRYDLRHGAKVVGGPAPRPLPGLPIKVADNMLIVAGPFTSRVGGEQPQGA